MYTICSGVNLLVRIALVLPLVGDRDEALYARRRGSGKRVKTRPWRWREWQSRVTFGSRTIWRPNGLTRMPGERLSTGTEEYQVRAKA